MRLFYELTCGVLGIVSWNINPLMNASPREFLNIVHKSSVVNIIATAMLPQFAVVFT